ncbi:MAG TPA: RNA polymerase sigma factor, partial [Longimicrobium sp.]|nr:RNA polymerase sigma factor [Longimicrobium sp.]
GSASMNHDPHQSPEPGWVPDGPPGAIARIQEHLRQMRAKAYRAVGDSDVASDLAQKTFERFLEKGTYPEGTLYTILKHLVIDWTREQKKYVTRGTDTDRVLESIPTPDPDPLTEAVANDENQRKMKIIDRLPPADRELLLRRYYLGESLQEIADDLGLTEGALRTRICRAKKLACGMLEDS